LSESFAMDGFTQAKRKGSARMMQRFVQVCLIRGDGRPILPYGPTTYSNSLS